MSRTSGRSRRSRRRSGSGWSSAGSRSAASIGKAALDAAVVERAKELEQGNEAHAVEVATAAQQQVTQATEAAKRAQSMAAASYLAWERYFDDLSAQAKGNVDHVAVRAEQEKVSEELRSFASTHTTAWASMRKVRERDLAGPTRTR